MAEYSDEFASLAKDALDPDLSEEERISALKAAIHACMDEAEGDDGDDEAAEGESPAKGLALVFGGGAKRKKG